MERKDCDQKDGTGTRTKRSRRPTKKGRPSRTIVTNTPDENQCTVVNRTIITNTPDENQCTVVNRQNYIRDRCK